MAAMYEDVADYLVSLSLGIKGTDLFGNNFPASPDNIASLFEHPGYEPDLAMGRLAHDVLKLQVLVRNVSVTNARNRAFTIRNALVAFNYLSESARTLNGSLYLGILPQSAPYPIGADENRRSQWSSMYLVRKRP